MSTYSALLAGEPTSAPRRDLQKPIIAVTYSSAEFGDPRDALPWQLAFRAVVAAGGVPLAIDCSTAQTRIADLVELADGLILLGGVDVSPVLYGGDPSDPTVGAANRVRDENELAALQVAHRLQRPTLAICRGFQLFNVSRGGTLVADLERDVTNIGSHHPGPDQLMRPHHSVQVDPSSQIAKWMSRSGRLAVNSYHHQGIDAVGEHLRITARADDGLVESLESSDGLIVAVQWHPEFLWPVDANSLALLTGFVTSCKPTESRDTRQTAGGLSPKRSSFLDPTRNL